MLTWIAAAKPSPVSYGPVGPALIAAAATEGHTAVLQIPDFVAPPLTYVNVRYQNLDHSLLVICADFVASYASDQTRTFG